MAAGVLEQAPDWMQGVGSLLALVFASVAVVVARRTYGIESERDRVNAERREKQDLFERRSQAARISAWWGRSPEGEPGVFVRNASEAPVYQLYATILPAERRYEDDGTKVQNLVVPPAPEPIFLPTPDPIARPAAVRRVMVTFTDASGVRWQRNQYGRLRELQPHVTVLADDVRAAALSNFREDFRDTYGVDVSFQAKGLTMTLDRLTEEMATVRDVDAVVYPHDWIGALIERDSIAPTLLTADHRAAFPEWALRALTVDGRLYGIPTTIDTAALLRNTDLAPEAPATFEELLETGLALQAAGRVEQPFALRVGAAGEPFQIWPLFAGAGGRLFETTEAGWDPSRILLATEESVAALTHLRELGEAGLGVLRRSVDRAEAIELFCAGRTPFLVSTADAMKHVRAAGIPVAVSAVPGVDGVSGEPTFTAVHGLMLARHGRSRVTAMDLFADYLAHDDVMDALCRHVVAPVGAHGVPGDPAVAEYTRLCAAGRPMPAFPQMKQTWNVLARMEVAVIAGEDPKVAATAAAREIEKLYQRTG
ncbi:maltose-binding protein MalE [Nocardia transvalensis]|uniref:Maltose-binding protein MalE n=1 Tax=Nocardia transvalensis TaxID=37333 RepID=A0A7W9PKY6_9NOCA|nr:extracellular solute-binding protein [Nocardia transvalensis]MBB5918099.1 maltose-binding protein MalE [Nocardia transvalensis]